MAKEKTPVILKPSSPLAKAIKNSSRDALRLHLGLTAQAMYSFMKRTRDGIPIKPDLILRIAAVAQVAPYSMDKDVYLKEWAVPFYGLTPAGRKKKLIPIDHPSAHELPRPKKAAATPAAKAMPKPKKPQSVADAVIK